jgi:hypothetical protein
MQLTVVPTAAPQHLDRGKWHNPLISIVVTHHDYSDHVADALLSLLDQTHQNWECVVVDDGSDDGHRLAVETIIRQISDPRIRLLALSDNVGQIPAFFAGLDATTGEFVCLLDPDDRYDETFLAEMLDTHLSEAVFAPIACADQRVVHDGKAITGTYSTLPIRLLEKDQHTGYAEVPAAIAHRTFYIGAHQHGWHWTSTSAMMFRRAALDLLRPHRALGYRGSADSYLAQGAHLLGGTLRLTKPLIYRTAHSGNAWLCEGVYASTQNKRRPNGSEASRQCLVDVVEAIKANGGEKNLATAQRKRPLVRWRNSIVKRWRKLTGGRHGQ